MPGIEGKEGLDRVMARTLCLLFVRTGPVDVHTQRSHHDSADYNYSKDQNEDYGSCPQRSLWHEPRLQEEIRRFGDSYFAFARNFETDGVEMQPTLSRCERMGHPVNGLGQGFDEGFDLKVAGAAGDVHGTEDEGLSGK